MGNSKAVHKNNLAAVMGLIHEREGAGGISRKEIAAQTGLTAATVTNLVSRLMGEHYLVEAGEGESTLGRKPIQLRINRCRYGLVGIELSADAVVCIVTDFCGGTLARGSAPSRGGASPKEAVALIWRLTERLLQDAKVPKEKVFGIGLMTSGPYDRETGTLFDPPNFIGEGWRCAPLKKLMEEEAGLPVFLDRDSVGCVLAETGLGVTDQTEAATVAVMVNTVGIGGGLMVGRNVFYGQANAAAEVGHMTVLVDGPICGCGDRGCLEAVSSGQAVANAMGQMTGAPVTVEELIREYRRGNPQAVEAAHQGAKYLGVAVGNLIKCLSPQWIAVGGRFISAFPEYYDLTCQYARSRRYIRMGEGTKLIPFSHGENQSAMGAVKLLLHQFYHAMIQ